MKLLQSIRRWWQVRQINKRLQRLQRKHNQQKIDDHHNCRCTSLPVSKRFDIANKVAQDDLHDYPAHFDLASYVKALVAVKDDLPDIESED